MRGLLSLFSPPSNGNTAAPPEQASPDTPSLHWRENPQSGHLSLADFDHLIDIIENRLDPCLNRMLGSLKSQEWDFGANGFGQVIARKFFGQTSHGLRNFRESYIAGLELKWAPDDSTFSLGVIQSLWHKEHNGHAMVNGPRLFTPLTLNGLNADDLATLEQLESPDASQLKAWLDAFDGSKEPVSGPLDGPWQNLAGSRIPCLGMSHAAPKASGLNFGER